MLMEFVYNAFLVSANGMHGYPRDRGSFQNLGGTKLLSFRHFSLPVPSSFIPYLRPTLPFFYLKSRSEKLVNGLAPL